MPDGQKGNKGAAGEPIVRIRLTEEEKKKARRLLIRHLAGSVVDRLPRGNEMTDAVACEKTGRQDAAR